MDHKFEIDTFQFLQQKSEDWFRVRSKATVTGSTLNSALGLDTLKKQQEHYDSVKHGKEKAEPSAGIKERMDYGTANEIHAVATLVAKVLPVLFPNMTFTEVGCLQKEDNNITYVISPDGRCDETLADQNTKDICYRNKMPVPCISWKVTSSQFTTASQNIISRKFCRRYLDRMPCPTEYLQSRLRNEKFVHIECLDGITAGKKKIDDSLHASLSQSKMIKDWSEGKRKQSSAKNSSEEVGEIGVEIIDTLSSNDRVVLTEELLQEDLDPKGSGVLRPDDIPAAISVAVELLDVKLDQNRGFEMETTRSKVYPTNMMSSLSNDAMTTSVDGGVWRDLTSVDPIDHAFDYPERAKRKPKRRNRLLCLSLMSLLRDVCQYANIIVAMSPKYPHVRRGLNLNDIKKTYILK
ncbi:hypothetical protein ScPMuIL_014535 [Solemya velum]